MVFLQVRVCVLTRQSKGGQAGWVLEILSLDMTSGSLRGNAQRGTATSCTPDSSRSPISEPQLSTVSFITTHRRHGSLDRFRDCGKYPSVRGRWMRNLLRRERNLPINGGREERNGRAKIGRGRYSNSKCATRRVKNPEQRRKRPQGSRCEIPRTFAEAREDPRKTHRSRERSVSEGRKHAGINCGDVEQQGHLRS
jgi:hypothetical protein